MILYGIVAIGPISVTGVLFLFFVVPGFVWSPFAALIAWYLARRRGLSARRYALVGAAYSIFLLVPWLRLIVGMLTQREPGFVGPVNFLLYFAWLVGPIVFWGQYIVFVGQEEFGVFPLLVSVGILATMFIMWIASVVISLRQAYDYYTDLPVMSFRYIMPFVLAWGCTLFIYGYLNVYRSN